MTFSKRIAGAVVAVCMLAGGSVALAAPANAASTYISPLYGTKASCQSAEEAKSTQLIRAGKRIVSGDSCTGIRLAYPTGIKVAWRFSINYTG